MIRSSQAVDNQISNCFLPELRFGKNTLWRPRSAALAPTNEAKAEAMEREHLPRKPNEAGPMLYAALPSGQRNNRTLVLSRKV